MKVNTITKKLVSDISKEMLIDNLIIKLKNFFYISDEEEEMIMNIQDEVFDRLSVCINGVDNKYFKKENKAFFSYTHSGQYLIFLYLFSNQSAKNGYTSLKDKFYYLNKILHSVDIYSEVNLPEIFFLEHPMGTVLGRADYGNNFFAMQGCTVGGDKNTYPILGDNLKMYSNSKILGKCKIGNNVILGADASVKNTDIPDNSMVFGQYPNLIIKEIRKCTY